MDRKNFFFQQKGNVYQNVVTSINCPIVEREENYKQWQKIKRSRFYRQNFSHREPVVNPGYFHSETLSSHTKEVWVTCVGAWVISVEPSQLGSGCKTEFVRSKGFNVCF